jgi:hypothetical protein
MSQLTGKKNNPQINEVVFINAWCLNVIRQTVSAKKNQYY